MENFLPLVFYFLVIIPSSIFHEYAHAWMADMLGDQTARYAGRLTMDPRAHIDRWGTLLLPLMLFFFTQGRFLFAYAKPVPFNPYNLKNQRLGPLWVALAGPGANLLIAIFFGLVTRYLPLPTLTPFFLIIVYANVLLAVFNLVPIPPLDGSKLLYAFLPEKQAHLQAWFERYGIMVLLFFMFFGFSFLTPIIQSLTIFLTGGRGF